MGLWHFFVFFDIFITFFFWCFFVIFCFCLVCWDFGGFCFLIFVLSFIFLRDYWVCLRYVLGTVLEIFFQDRPSFSFFQDRPSFSFFQDRPRNRKEEILLLRISSFYYFIILFFYSFYNLFLYKHSA